MAFKPPKVYHFLFKKYPRASLLVFVLFCLIYWFSLPNPLFQDPYSFVLQDQTGELLGAKIAEDGQWRFPSGDSIPEKFKTALIEFEDRRFYSHPGIDPIGLARAIVQNIRAGAIISGGSTISMQTIRLARKPKSRNLWQKLIELVLATRLELAYSKEEILNYYTAHAPFGGNVVGLESACWRYYGKGPHLLSWAEAATLAVLPNSPGLIHPGRNRDALEAKRNRLLDRLWKAGKLDSLTCQLAKLERLPEKPIPLPRLAPHLLERAKLENPQQPRFTSTLDQSLQSRVNPILNRHQAILSRKEIHNLAAIIIEVETGAVRSYVGNIIGAGEAHGEQVDVIKAPRSTGSILKPILYALMLQEGSLLPNMLIPDIPSQMGGYRPKNYNEAYDGLVPAQKSLIRSLNVPFVHLLSQYGLEKFHHELQALELKHIQQAPGYYGLPLILGGAEASLFEISSIYASMARTLNHFYDQNGEYALEDFRQASYHKQAIHPKHKTIQKTPPRLSAAAIWFTFEAMKNLERPNTEGEWQYFQSSQDIAWKTGTSFGFRDAWAVGLNRDYVIGVWAGNGDGEGRPGLVGVEAAAPVLFELFDLLPSTHWFDPPYDEMIELPRCKQSGFRIGPYCPADTAWAPLTAQNVPPCPFHQLVHLDEQMEWQVSSDCETPSKIKHIPWFLLPPTEEYYYKSKNPSYKTLPPWRIDCRSSKDEVVGRSMQLIYPRYPSQIYVPIDLDGELSRTVFRLAHRNPETIVHWHLDNEYIKSTQTFHTLEIAPKEGHHKLTLVDEHGNRLEQNFEIIQKGK